MRARTLSLIVVPDHRGRRVDQPRCTASVRSQQHRPARRRGGTSQLSTSVRVRPRSDLRDANEPGSRPLIVRLGKYTVLCRALAQDRRGALGSPWAGRHQLLELAGHRPSMSEWIEWRTPVVAAAIVVRAARPSPRRTRRAPLTGGRNCSTAIGFGSSREARPAQSFDRRARRRLVRHHRVTACRSGSRPASSSCSRACSAARPRRPPAGRAGERSTMLSIELSASPKYSWKPGPDSARRANTKPRWIATFRTGTTPAAALDVASAVPS